MRFQVVPKLSTLDDLERCRSTPTLAPHSPPLPYRRCCHLANKLKPYLGLCHLFTCFHLKFTLTARSAFSISALAAVSRSMIFSLQCPTLTPKFCVCGQCDFYVRSDRTDKLHETPVNDNDSAKHITSRTDNAAHVTTEVNRCVSPVNRLLTFHCA